MHRIAAISLALLLWASGPALSQNGEMTAERMGELVEAVGDDVTKPAEGQWRLRVEGVPAFIVTDVKANRMRILVGISKVDELPPNILQRLMQANFDTALDARYAVARGYVWAAYLHPLKSLSDAEFLSGLGQTVNLARTFGKTYSSGGLSYGGGDSSGIIERELIENLLEKGLAI